MLILLLNLLLSVNVHALGCDKSYNLKQLNDLRINDIQFEPKFNTHFINKVDPAKGYFLTVHGLNNSNRLMNPLTQEITGLGHTALNVALLGHRGSLEEAKVVKLSHLEDQIKKSYCILKNKAKGKPLYLVGFSLGGALLVNFLQSHPEEIKNVKQLFLFSPAVSLTKYSKFTKISSSLPTSWRLPSRLEEKIKANNSVPMSLFLATWQVYEKTKKTGLDKLNNVPVTVFMDKKDYLVSYKNLKQSTKDLSNWHYVYTPVLLTKYQRATRHLSVHPYGLGKIGWSQLISSIKKRLKP